MFMVCVVLIILGLVFDSGLFRDLEIYFIVCFFFVSGIVSLIFLIVVLSGIVFGVVMGCYYCKGSVIEDMEVIMVMMVSYLVLMFFVV